MSTPVHKVLGDANEIRENAEHGNKIAALAAAIIAVLASLASMFAHHASITALTAKSTEILIQGRMFDTQASIEAKTIRTNLYDALLLADIARNPKASAAFEKANQTQKDQLTALIKTRQELEGLIADSEHHSQVAFNAYQTIEWGTALLEMSIVMVGISTLSRTRVLLLFAIIVSSIGVILAAIGLYQGH